MKLKYFIDWNKGITFLVLTGMVAYFRQWNNPTAMVYLALHGSYGILWVLKSRLFPDKQWEQHIPLWFGIVSWLALTLYWLPAWLITSRSIQAPDWVIALCVSAYIFGVFFHFTSDMQKHTALELNPETLITTKMFSLARNINYFGELLIYGSMAALSLTWIAFLPLAAFILFYWLPNMVRKDRSLARYHDFETYKHSAHWIIPFLL